MIGNKKDYVSLDIGYGGIKAAKGLSYGKTLSLETFIHEPYPASDISVVNTDYLENKVREFVKKHHIQGNIVYSMSDPSLTVQGFHIPNMPYDEIPEAVKWEIARNLKLDPNDTLYDFVICNNSPEGDKDGFYIIAGICSREPYERVGYVLRKERLKILGCDLPVLSDLRIMDKLGLLSLDKTFILINFGALFTNLSILYKKGLIFDRRISLNGHLLTRAIKDYCRVDDEAAENLKVGYGLSADVLSDNIIESVNIVNSNCEKMVSDIQYSLKYFSYQVSRSNITTFDKVYITGGGSHLKGFREFLQERLNIEVAHISLENKLSIQKSVLPEKQEKDKWMAYCLTAVGGLLWSRKTLNKNCVNLLPGELTEGGKKEFISFKTVLKRFFSIFGAALILFAFIIALLLTRHYQNRQIKQLSRSKENEERRKDQIERNNTDLLAIKAQKVKENEELELQIAVLKQKLQDMKTYDSSDYNPAYYFAEVSNLVPHPYVVLSVMTFEEDRIVIRGDAASNHVISVFMKSLNDSKYFHNTNFEFMEKSTDNKSMYPINFQIVTKVSLGLKK